MFSVRQIHDPDHAAEREGSMGSSQGLHVEQFAVGCLFAMKGLAIPGSDPTILNPYVQLRFPLGNPGTGA
jgi:hypothetical protein